MSYGILFVIALAISALGFKRFIWFISIGYGFSMAAIGVALIVMFHDTADPASLTLCALMVVYGLRLGGYLALREARNANYRKVLDSAGGEKQYPLGFKLMIWGFCALLYACEASPVLWRLQAGTGANVLGVVGCVVAICGVVLESASDLQKTAAKKANPGHFVSTGLFSIVRCPNYLGELLTWTGVFVSGLGSAQTPLQWVAAIGGWVGITYVMLSGARRLELRQNKNYGDDPEYQAYVSSVPIVLPFVPLYSVKDCDWIRV